MGGDKLREVIIPRGTPIVCPYCGKTLYVFKYPMNTSVIVALVYKYLQAVSPQYNLDRTPKEFNCSCCGRKVELLSQLAFFVEVYRKEKVYVK